MNGGPAPEAPKQKPSWFDATTGQDLRDPAAPLLWGLLAGGVLVDLFTGWVLDALVGFPRSPGLAGLALRLAALAAYIAAASVLWRARAPAVPAALVPPEPARRLVPPGIQNALLLAGAVVAFLLAPRVASELEYQEDYGRVPAWVPVAAWAAAVGGYTAWAVRFARFRAQAVPDPAQPGQWTDSALKAGLFAIGVLVATAALFMLGLVRLAVCWTSCDGWRSALPLLMLLVPAGYAAAAVAVVRSRARRAAADPAWAARAARGGHTFAAVAAVTLLMILLLAGTCFALVGLGTRP